MATLIPLVHQDLISKSQFNRSDYLFINIENNQPNVSQVVYAMEHPANSLHDLDFVVLTNMSSLEDICKCFLYFDNIKSGALITDYLSTPSFVDMLLSDFIIVQCPRNITSRL
jgi:hypothetical protein